MPIWMVKKNGKKHKEKDHKEKDRKENNKKEVYFEKNIEEEIHKKKKEIIS